MPLEEKIQLSHLKLLQRKFSEFSQNAEVENDLLPHGVTEEYFVNSIGDVLGSSDYNMDAKEMFKEIDNENNGKHRVTWDQLLNHLITNLTHRLNKNPLAPFLDQHKIHRLAHNKRESTRTIITINASSFVYLFISKIGTVGIFDQHLQHLNSYQIEFEDHKQFGPKKVIPIWINHAIYMPDCKKLVLAANNQTIYFFDISSSVHVEEFRVYGLPHNATCLEYSFDETGESGSFLFVGDEIGNVQLFHFLQPKNMLFKKSDMEGSTRIFFQDFQLIHGEFLSHRILEKIHNDAVTKVRFLDHNKSLMTCSDDCHTPLAISDIDNRWSSYIFETPKGIRCFDFNSSLKLLVTGGRDCILRFWNPYVTTQPMAHLEGHKSCLVDVRISVLEDLVFSYSKDGVLMTWNISNYHCLQILQLKFPCIKNHHKDEYLHGSASLHLDTWGKRSILATCGEYLTEVKFCQQKNKSKYEASNSSQRRSESNKTAPLPALQATKKSVLVDLLDEESSWKLFGSYVFSKLAKTNAGGHPLQVEMSKLVAAGSPYCALKIPEPQDNIFPEEQQMRQLMWNTSRHM